MYMLPGSTSLCPGDNDGARRSGSLLCDGAFSSSSMDTGATCDLRTFISSDEEVPGVGGVEAEPHELFSRFASLGFSRSTLATSCGITATCESWETQWSDRVGFSRKEGLSVARGRVLPGDSWACSSWALTGGPAKCKKERQYTLHGQ